MIKVKLPLRHKGLSGERVWVSLLSHDTGEIVNLPFLATEFKYRDIIKFDPDTREFLEKIVDGGFIRTKVYQYTGDYLEEKAYWESRGYVVERFAPGILGVSKRRSRV